MDLVLTPRRRHAATLMLAGLAMLAGTARAAGPSGNAANGATLFATHCAECHSVREGKDKKGPTLFAVMGRAAAASPGFVYSDALKASGIHWTPNELDAYMAAPKQRVPGGKMKFDGLPSAAERADLIAYLSALPPTAK